MNAGKLTVTLALATIVTMGAGSALADAIDGDWCVPDGPSRLRIAGSNITTPVGTQTTGNYSRNAFSYIVPDNDTGSGQPIDMVLLNEEEVRLSANGGEPQIWRRCQIIS